LLFHQQVHLVEAIKSSAVLVNVMLQWLLESKHRNATFVLEKIAHARGSFGALVLCKCSVRRIMKVGENLHFYPL